MRIDRTFDLGHLKCTLFLYEGQYTLQIEDEYGMITYKLRELEGAGLDDLSDLVHLKSIKDEVITSFRSMRRGRDQLISMLLDSPDLEEEII